MSRRIGSGSNVKQDPMSGGSFTVLRHTLVVAVVRVSHVEDGELGPPGQWVHGGRGRLVLAAVSDRAGRSNL